MIKPNWKFTQDEDPGVFQPGAQPQLSGTAWFWEPGHPISPHDLTTWKVRWQLDEAGCVTKGQWWLFLSQYHRTILEAEFNEWCFIRCSEPLIGEMTMMTLETTSLPVQLKADGWATLRWWSSGLKNLEKSQGVGLCHWLPAHWNEENYLKTMMTSPSRLCNASNHIEKPSKCVKNRPSI